MPEVIRVIEAKRDGAALSSRQIADMVNGFTSGSIPEYQMSAFLMAVVCRDMNDAETVSLTKAMLDTGETLDLSSIPGLKLDKHSTGGVGDKVSLALVPIVAAAGIPIAKMSGRGLGHTGGTLDKLASIPGFKSELTSKEIIRQVREIGACLCAQTEKIVPADKKIYALRDVTGTVESMPLIASSIMSKKIAGGADIILLDVKVGRGAFMKSIEDARRLANLMRMIGSSFGKVVVCELTSMEAPIGQAVGNAIEIYEVVSLLKGKPVDSRLLSLVIELSDAALKAANSKYRASELIEDGSAWKKFVEIVNAQCGDMELFGRRSSLIPVGVIHAGEAGFVTDIDAFAIGRAAGHLGAGRLRKDDIIDPLAGIWIDSVVGTEVNYGARLATLYGSSQRATNELSNDVVRAFTISERAHDRQPVIIETISGGEQP